MLQRFHWCIFYGNRYKASEYRFDCWAVLHNKNIRSSNMDNLKKSLYSSVGIVCLPVALLPRPHFRIRKYSFSSFIQYFEHAIQLKILNYIEKVQHLAISLPFYTFFLCNNLIIFFFFCFFLQWIKWIA